MHIFGSINVAISVERHFIHFTHGIIIH